MPLGNRENCNSEWSQLPHQHGKHPAGKPLPSETSVSAAQGRRVARCLLKKTGQFRIIHSKCLPVLFVSDSILPSLLRGCSAEQNPVYKGTDSRGEQGDTGWQEGRRVSLQGLLHQHGKAKPAEQLLSPPPGEGPNKNLLYFNFNIFLKLFFVLLGWGERK